MTRPTALALALALAGGCADADLFRQPRQECTSDADCGEPFICVLGACYDPSDAAFNQVSIEVVPPSSARLPAQQFTDLVPSSDRRTEVILARAVQVDAVVKDPQGVPMAALVLAQTPSAVPGRVLRSNDSSSGDGHLSLLLIEGRSYQLQVFPDDADQVPFVPESLYASESLAGSALTLQLDEPLTTVSGRVISSTADDRGFPNLRVQITGLVAGLDEVRVVSTTARTAAGDEGSDPKGGSFSVQLPQRFSSDLTLRVSPTEGSDAAPKVEVSGINLSGDLDLGLIEIGNVGTTVTVTGSVTGPDMPVASADIYFEGDVGAGRYTAWTATGQDSAFSLPLLAGYYRAVVAPRADDRAALTELKDPVLIDYGEGGTLQVDFSTQARASLQGRVVDVDGAAVASAVVRATRSGNALERPGPGDLIRSTFETRTGNDGGYALAVDPGRYEVVVIPVADTLAPRWTGVVTVGLADSQLDIRLQAPAAFGGRVVRSGGGPGMPDALVRAYIVLEDQRVMLVGEELTDADGNFGMVLPDFQRQE